MFRTVPLSIIRSFSLYTQQWYMSYRFVDSLRAGSGPNWFHPEPACKLSANLYDMYQCCVYSEKLLMMDRGTVRNIQSFIPKINLRNQCILKGKVIPLQARCGPEGGQRYSSTLPWWSAARPGRSLPPGKTRYPLHRRLGGPQDKSGRAENLVPTGFRSRTVQPVAQSLYRLSYPVHNQYIQLVLLVEFITMHGHLNVKFIGRISKKVYIQQSINVYKC